MSGYSERRGAHRPAGLGPTSAIPWLVAAVAIVAIVVVASGWFGGSQEPTSNTVPAGPSTTGKATKAATKTTKASPTTSATPAQVADRTLAVSVLNSTSTTGLAAKGAAALKDGGWAIRGTGNFSGSVSRTTVFYGSAKLRATAEAVAKDLGVPASITESADFGATRVTVVLAADFQP